MKLIECVPNFSEGRRPEVIQEIAGAIASVPGIKLLDQSSDASHNRSVITFAGEPAAVKEAALRATRRAAELINMEQHRGEHPRIGATDVIPLVPISGVSMEECVALARELGRAIGEKLGIPVYLYEEAALSPEEPGRGAPGEYEGLRRPLNNGPSPDFGLRLHPRRCYRRGRAPTADCL